MKRYKVVLLVLLILGCAFVIYQQRTAPYQHCEGKIFGTYYNATYQNDKDLSKEILKALQDVDASLSMFNPESTISKINNNEDTVLDKPMLYLLPRALKVSEATDGAFDITVAPLVNAWGFGFKGEALPSEQTVDSIRSFVGYEKIRIKGQNIKKDDPRTMLDLSAIAKGYGADMVAQVLDKNKVRNYMIEIGGDIVVHGKGSSGKDWHIGLSKPVENDSILSGFQCILGLTDCAVATSGNYRNFFFKDGVRYMHTIDPHTGYPVQRDILSATIIAPRCYEADAYATAAMVLGLEKMKEVLSRHKDLEAYFIYTSSTGEQETWMTKGFEKHIK